MGWKSCWLGGLLVLFALVGTATQDDPVIDHKLAKRIEELDVRLNRMTKVYSDIYWKAIVASVDNFGLQLSAFKRKRAAIGDECRYLFDLHYNDEIGMLH